MILDKISEKWFLKKFSGKFLMVFFQFFHVMNYSLFCLLLSYGEVLSPHFYTHTSQAWSVLQNLVYIV